MPSALSVVLHVTVDSQGVLTSGPNNGSALLKVVAVETCGVSKTHQCSVQLIICALDPNDE